MKEEEEKRIANMTRAEFAKLTGSASASALDEAGLDAETDLALDQVDEMDKMVAGGSGASSRKVSAPASLQPHTAKGERLLRERLEREGGLDEEPSEEGCDAAAAADTSLSPAEKRAKDAERRAAWRKARLKSLENVSQPLF